YRDSGSGEQAQAWFYVALLQGGLALVADRLLARSFRFLERILWYFVSSVVLGCVVWAGLGQIEDRRRSARIAPPEAVAANRTTESDEGAAAAALLWIHCAVQRYRLSHPDVGYPASLADVARDAATGQDSPPPSFRSVLATGAWSGYRIQYRALPGGE